MKNLKHSSELRVTRVIFIFSFLISSILLMLLATAQPLKSNIAASYLWLAALVFGVIAIGGCRGKRKKYLKFFLLIAVLNIIIVPPELYLRLKGFRYETGIQFGYPRPYQFKVFVPDEKLFWKFPPSSPGINSFGFQEREVQIPKPAGTVRIVFLGNSTVYQGHPHMVELILKEVEPGVECLNFAIPGYSSYQGKVITKTILPDLQPDAVAVTFGWNDRWLAYGSVDEEKKITINKSPVAGAISRLYNRWRLLQFARKLLSPVLGGSNPLNVSRVPLEQFKQNLRTIGEENSRLGAVTIFITKPSAHHVLGVPDYIVESRYAESKEKSLELLDSYNNAIREVAGEREDWLLLDLDRHLSTRNDVRSIFTKDGFHFSRSGLALVASIESGFIAKHVLHKSLDFKCVPLEQ